MSIAGLWLMRTNASEFFFPACLHPLKSHKPIVPLSPYPLPNGDWKWVSRSWAIYMRCDGQVLYHGLEYSWFFQSQSSVASYGGRSRFSWRSGLQSLAPFASSSPSVVLVSSGKAMEVMIGEGITTTSKLLVETEEVVVWFARRCRG